MIPENITKDHRLKAIEEMDQKGFPETREANKFELAYSGKRYPSKYTINLGNKYANGK
jgi:hypothetical protein